MVAGEGAFIELLVANERVGRILDVLADPSRRTRHKASILQLHAEVQRGSSYAEEAQRLGAIQILTSLLARTTDEAVMDAVSRIIALCSGPMALGGRLSTFRYGPVSIFVREGALGDGLGAQVWSVAHIMCRELLAHPQLVAGHVVLELGSGTGLCGIMAAKLGAQQVLLTDHEPRVLLNLRACMHLNSSSSSSSSSSSEISSASCWPEGAGGAGAAEEASSTAAAPPLGGAAAGGAPSHALADFSSDEEADQRGLPAQQQQEQQQQPGKGCTAVQPCNAGAHVVDAQLLDDVESMEDLDLGSLLSPRSSGARGGRELDRDAAAAAVASTGWEVDNMAVRLLDWQESADATAPLCASGIAGEGAASGQPPSAAPAAAAAAAAPSLAPAAACARVAGGGCCYDGGARPAGVPLDRRFSVVLGNEVMYEPAHAALVAAALHHRLAPGGRALLCCAVRSQSVFDTFRDSCALRGLRYRALHVQQHGEERDAGGIRGRDGDYEGGYLLMAVDHSSRPADWHRDDFQPVP